MDRGTDTNDQRRTALQALADLTSAFSSTSDWPNHLPRVVETLAETLPRGRVGLGLMHDSKWWATQAPDCASPDFADSLHGHYLGLAASTPVGAAFRDGSLIAPILSNHAVIGVLLAQNEQPSSESENLLTIVASQIGLYMTSVALQATVCNSQETIDSLARKADQSLSEFDTLIDSLAEAVVIFDKNGNPVKVNKVTTLELGWDPRRFNPHECYRRTDPRHPDGAPVPIDEISVTKALSGISVKDQPVVVKCADGRTIHALGSAAPIRADGRIVGVIASWHDITEIKVSQMQGEDSLKRHKRLARIAAGIIAASSVEEVTRRATAAAVKLVGADACAIGYDPVGTEFRVTAAAGFPEAEQKLLGPHHAEMLDKVMKRTGPKKTAVTRSCSLRDEQHSGQKWSVVETITAPLWTGESADGVMLAIRQDGDAFTEEDESLLSHLAAFVSLRIRSIEAETDAERRAAEAKEGRRMLEALMQYAVDGIAISDSKDGSLLTVSKRGLEMLGIQPHDGSLSRIADRELVWHADGSAPLRAEEMALYRAAVLGEEVLNEERLLHRPDGWEIPTLSNAGPIRNADGEVIGGILTFRDISDLKAAQHELEAAYKRERRISDVLQQALLPSVSIDTPDYELASRYHPALAESQVGGDFYDAFDVGEGWMALLMGDVSGKGLHAAAYTSMAKYMIRAYAHEDPEPKSVLRRLNETLSGSIADDTFITVFFGLYDTARGVLAFANAGHEPPILCAPDGASTMELDVTGPAIGIAPKSAYGQRVIQLEPGNTLVVYTDGITDSRSESAFFGYARLADVIASHAGGSPAEIAESIYQATMHHSNGQLSDDAALLVLKSKIISTPRPFPSSKAMGRKARD